MVCTDREVSVFYLGVADDAVEVDVLAEFCLASQTEFIDCGMGAHAPFHFRPLGVQAERCFVGQIMADRAVVFAGIAAHSVTHDGVMIGPAVIEALMTVPDVAGISHFQGHIP